MAAAIFVDHIKQWWNIVGIIIFFLASFAYSCITFTNKAQRESHVPAAKSAEVLPTESTDLLKKPD